MQSSKTSSHKQSKIGHICALLFFTLSFSGVNLTFAQDQETAEEQEVFDDTRGDISIDQETLDKAESAFFEGLSAYKAKKYTEAARLFETAHKLVPYRDLLFNIARSYESLDDRASAIKYYRAYLATKPIDETQIIHRMRELGVNQFDEPKSKENDPLSPPKIPHHQESEIDYLSWSLIGGGAALLGVGSYFGMSALDQAERARNASRKAKYNDAKSQAESDALLADVGITLGVATISSGLYLLFFKESSSVIKDSKLAPHAQKTSQRQSWQVLYSPEFKGLGLIGSF